MEYILVQVQDNECKIFYTLKSYNQSYFKRNSSLLKLINLSYINRKSNLNLIHIYNYYIRGTLCGHTINFYVLVITLIFNNNSKYIYNFITNI